MGIFSRLFGGKSDDEDQAQQATAPTGPASPAAPAPASSPWLRTTEDQWDDWEDNQRLDFCKGQLERLKAAYGDGKLRKVTSNDEVQLRTTAHGHPVTVVVDYDTGWMSLKMKFVNRRGHVFLQFDEDKKLSSVENDPDSEWEEDDDGGQIVEVFADGVYIEEYANEATPMIERVRQTPEPLRQVMFQALQSRSFNMLFVDGEWIEGGLERCIYQIADPKAFCDQRLAVFAQIAEYFSQGSTQIGPKPRVYMYGKPVMPDNPPPRITCAYCSTPYTLDDDPRCPSCGAVGSA